MNDQEIAYLEMDQIINNAPIIFRNSLIAKTIQILALLIGIISVAVGLGLLISASIQQTFVKLILIEDLMTIEDTQMAQIERISIVTGAILIVLGLLIMVIAQLIRSLLRRKKFILSVKNNWQKIIVVNGAQ